MRNKKQITNDFVLPNSVAELKKNAKRVVHAFRGAVTAKDTESVTDAFLDISTALSHVDAGQALCMSMVRLYQNAVKASDIDSEFVPLPLPLEDAVKMVDTAEAVLAALPDNAPIINRNTVQNAKNSYGRPDNSLVVSLHIIGDEYPWDERYDDAVEDAIEALAVRVNDAVTATGVVGAGVQSSDSAGNPSWTYPIVGDAAEAVAKLRAFADSYGVVTNDSGHDYDVTDSTHSYTLEIELEPLDLSEKIEATGWQKGRSAVDVTGIYMLIELADVPNTVITNRASKHFHKLPDLKAFLAGLPVDGRFNVFFKNVADRPEYESALFAAVRQFEGAIPVANLPAVVRRVAKVLTTPNDTLGGKPFTTIDAREYFVEFNYLATGVLVAKLDLYDERQRGVGAVYAVFEPMGFTLDTFLQNCAQPTDSRSITNGAPIKLPNVTALRQALAVMPADAQFTVRPVVVGTSADTEGKALEASVRGLLGTLEGTTVDVKGLLQTINQTKTQLAALAKLDKLVFFIAPTSGFDPAEYRYTAQGDGVVAVRFRLEAGASKWTGWTHFAIAFEPVGFKLAEYITNRRAPHSIAPRLIGNAHLGTPAQAVAPQEAATTLQNAHQFFAAIPAKGVVYFTNRTAVVNHLSKLSTVQGVLWGRVGTRGCIFNAANLKDK